MQVHVQRVVAIKLINRVHRPELVPRLAAKLDRLAGLRERGTHDGLGAGR